MRLVIIASFVAALGAAPLFAADAPPAGGWQRPTPQQMEAHRAEMDARRSADIALLLGLRADQKAGLDGFLATMHPHHGPEGRDGGHKPGDMPPPGSEGTIAALDRMSQHIDKRDAEEKQRIETTKRFYASLTPDQQRRADALMHLMHDHGGHGGPGRGHGPMGGPMGEHQPGDMPPPPPPAG